MLAKQIGNREGTKDVGAGPFPLAAK